MTPLRRIVRSSAAFLGSNFARAAIGFVLALAIGRGLGAERFGQWVLCTAWASLLTVVADLGFGVLLTRDGARARRTGRTPGCRRPRRAPRARRAAERLLYVGAAWIATDAGSIAGLRVAALLGVVERGIWMLQRDPRSRSRDGCRSCSASRPPGLPCRVAASSLIVRAGGAGGAVGWVDGAGGAVVALLVLAAVVQSAQIATALVLWRRVFVRTLDR